MPGHEDNLKGSTRMLDDDERAQHGDSESAGAGAAATGARHYGERTPGKGAPLVPHSLARPKRRQRGCSGTASARHPATQRAQPRPRRRRRGCLTTASARHRDPVTQLVPRRRRLDGEVTVR